MNIKQENNRKSSSKSFNNNANIPTYRTPISAPKPNPQSNPQPNTKSQQLYRVQLNNNTSNK